MTGPRTNFSNPQYRRGRRRLLLLIGLTGAPLACTSDQPSENSFESYSPYTGQRHPYLVVSDTGTADSGAAAPEISFSVTGQNVTPASGPRVLILADANGASTNALANSIAKAGYQVTTRPAPEFTWNGTNPALAGFHAVVHLNGMDWNVPLSATAQSELSNFVQTGGGFIAGQWNGYELSIGKMSGMSNLVLQGYGNTGKEKECGPCTMTYDVVPSQAGHPVLAGLPTSFTVAADGHQAGPMMPFLIDPSTMLARIPTGNPAVLVRQFGQGKVVNFSFSPNYGLAGAGRTLLDGNAQRLYLNALRWTTGGPPDADKDEVPDFWDNCPAVSNPNQADSDKNGIGDVCEGGKPQSISFGELSGKTFGDPDFGVSATASSELPVSFVAAGGCTISDATVHLTGAGSCTITAKQDGNSTYAPADPVSRSFPIAKGRAVLTVGTEFVFDGQPKAARITTDPAGLSGVTVSYTLNGVPVTSPTNAGTYQVLAHLEHPDFEAVDAHGTLTILPAAPSIHWPNPAPVIAGTPLGAAQQNASALGVGGQPLGGTFAYTPRAGTRLGIGRHLLVAEFTPADPNYNRAAKTVELQVTYRFSGFQLPVKNPPVVNIVKAGRVVPIKFSLGRYEGMRVVRPGSPSSAVVACPASAPSHLVSKGDDDDDDDRRSGFRREGSRYTYNWSTHRSWAGTCRKLVLTLADGTSHEALFRFESRSSRRQDRDSDRERRRDGDDD